MARLRVGTKAILKTASHTKNYHRTTRKVLAAALRKERLSSRLSYKYAGKQLERGNRPQPESLTSHYRSPWAKK